MSPINRRQFVAGSLATASLTALSPKAYAANDKIVIGVMGLGGRGRQLTSFFAQRPDTEITWLCDCNARRLQPALKLVENTQKRTPTTTQDYRQIIDDKEVHVIINATPDHWHGLASIQACQAAKDVYVEKPMSHNPFEGKQMLAAARKYRRVLTVGMQTRSAPYIRQAREIIASGKLGSIYLVRVYNMMQHPAAPIGPVQDPPDDLDYELWTGPAEMQPYHPKHRWLNYFNYSCGPIPGDAVHQLDLARYLMGDPEAPRNTLAQCGLNVLTDGRDTPDTQIATYSYPNFNLLFQGALWSPYMKKIPQSTRNSDAYPSFPFCSTKIEILGTKSFMYIGRHGGGWQIFNGASQLETSAYGRQADHEHIDNFLQCVRNRNRPNADVKQGHESAMLCHLANVAFRSGESKLEFDPETETITNSTKANRFLKRSYRKGWEVPESI